MKRVLVVDEALPHPPDSGKRIRTWELITRLAADFDVVMAYHDEGQTRADDIEAARDHGIDVLPVRRAPLQKQGLRFGWDLFRNLVHRVPYMVMAHRTRALRQAIRTAHAAEPFDVVHVEWTPLVANVPPDLGLPVCIAAHNVEADIWKRYHENESSFLRKRYIGIQHRKVDRFEKRAFQDADAVTAVSKHDAVRIRQWAPGTRIEEVPNGVNARYFAPQPEAPVDPDEVVFVGSLDWRPNLDGVEWFLDEVLPRLRKRHPRARISIVGRNPPDALRRRVDQTTGVTLHGSVPDVRPFVARAAVSCVPLRIGGGSRLKICEALAMERPVVSTTVGAEGLLLGDGLVRADTPDALADALTEVLREPERARARTAEGRARVLERYEWDGIAPVQGRLWEALAAGP